MQNNKIFYALIFLASFLLFSCDKEVSISPPEEAPDNGQLDLITSPGGFSIFIDSVNTGYKTPSKIKWLNTGQNLIELKRNLWRDTSFFIELYQDSMVKESINLVIPPFLGSISISSNIENAKILLNGDDSGEFTPSIFSNLLPGNYTIECSIAEHRSDHGNVTVRSSVETKYYAILQDTTVWVDYNYNNADFITNYVSKVAIDSKDNIFVVTAKHGFAQFIQGKSIIYNDTNSSLPTNSFYDILIDSKDDIWLSSAVGLIKFNGTSFITYNKGNSKLPGNLVFSCHEDKNNSIWVATNNGIAKLDPYGNWQVLNMDNFEIPSNRIKSISTYQDKIIIGTISSGISYFDGNNWHQYKEESFNDYSQSITKIISDEAGNFYIMHPPKFEGPILIHKGGVNRFDGSQFVEIDINLADIKVNDIFYENDLLYIGNKHGLQISENDGSITVYSSVDYDDMPGNYIKSIAVDSKGIIWLATYDKGIMKFKINNLE